MKSFKEFLSDADPTIQASQTSQASQASQTNLDGSKKWSGTKSEIISYWKKLRPDTPVFMRPMSYTHQGSTYGEDGIRITGSPKFIGSILARLKEVLVFENPATKLSIAYRQTASPSKALEGETKTSYVFYVNAKQRGDKNINTP
jgi:hypothetical protein